MPVLVGLDPGTAAFGAVALMLPERIVIAADVWTSERTEVGREKRAGVQADDHAIRFHAMSAWLRGCLREWGAAEVAAEAMVGRGKGAIEAAYTAWGATIGVVASCVEVPLRPVIQSVWKRAALKGTGKIDDDLLYAFLRGNQGDVVAEHLRRRRRVQSLLPHALDALGVALWAADKVAPR